jgi:hypothetical protein
VESRSRNHQSEAQSTELNSMRTEVSDFEDDEYLQELEEERIALKLVQLLKEWLAADKVSSKLKVELAKHQFIPNAFASALIAAGFPLSRQMDAVILLKYIFGGAKSKQETVQPSMLVDSLEQKEFSWW